MERSESAPCGDQGDSATSSCFFRERAKSGAGCKVVVVTGTNGKSTTSALTAHLLSAAGQRVALGGNIGKAVLDLEPFAPDLTYVLELSSFQIDLSPSLEPDAAALLNITPDHLDRHGTLQNYAAIKARVFAQLGAEATAVIGVDDEPCRAIAETLHGPFAVKRVAVGQPVQNGVWAVDGVIMEMDGGHEVGRAELEGIGSLRGAHNWQNAAAAYALARSQGLQADAIQQGLQSFAGLAHRMEQVARVGHVLFVNDSKATNADAAGKALGSLDDIYWIVGGRAKDGGLAGAGAVLPEDRPCLSHRRSGGRFRAPTGQRDPPTSLAARSRQPWRKPRPTQVCRKGPSRLCYCRPHVPLMISSTISPSAATPSANL